MPSDGEMILQHARRKEAQILIVSKPTTTKQDGKSAGMLGIGFSEARPNNGQDTKGVWWMPRYQEAKKDAASGETPRGAASKHRSVDIRMGEPNRGEPLLSLPEYIGQEKRNPVN